MFLEQEASKTMQSKEKRCFSNKKKQNYAKQCKTLFLEHKQAKTYQIQKKRILSKTQAKSTTNYANIQNHSN